MYRFLSIGSTLLITFVVENVMSHGVASSPVRMHMTSLHVNMNECVGMHHVFIL